MESYPKVMGHDKKGPGEKLQDIGTRIENILGAIERGVITEATTARLEPLEREKAELERVDDAPSMPEIHPNLDSLYRRKVEELHAALADPQTATQAITTIRSMIDKIVIRPRSKTECYDIEVYGKLATPLGLKDESSALLVSVVAGAGF